MDVVGDNVGKGLSPNYGGDNSILWHRVVY